MTDLGSWKLWVIIALALGTLACAGRRERREDAREERRERAEQRRAERAERNEARRGERSEPRRSERASSRSDDEPKTAERPVTTQSLTPVSTAPTAAVAEAKVVFVRPTYFVGDPVPAYVYDVTDSGPAVFIGIMNRKTRVEYPVRSGLRTFMIVSEAADFMQAHIVAGKTYYALITPRPGAWRARFSLVPVRQNEQRVAKWEEEIPLVSKTPSALTWAKRNAPSVEKKRDRFWPEWQSKPEDQRLSQTLNEEDGR